MLLAGREVHHRVGAPADRPDHLLDLLLDRGGDRRVADVGVDLHQEVAADDHRLELGVVDVGGDDGAAAGDLVAHELGRDLARDARRRSACARVLASRAALARSPALQVLADGDELHLRRDDAAAGVVHLRDVRARLARAAARRVRDEAQLRRARDRARGAAVARRSTPAAPRRRRGSAIQSRAQRRQPRAQVDRDVGIGVRPGGVVDAAAAGSARPRLLGAAAVRRRRLARSRASARAARGASAPGTYTLREAGSGPVVTLDGDDGSWVTGSMGKSLQPRPLSND